MIRQLVKVVDGDRAAERMPIQCLVVAGGPRAHVLGRPGSSNPTKH